MVALQLPGHDRLADILDIHNRLKFAKLCLYAEWPEVTVPIDFTLTNYQRRLQRIAREFANEILAP
ncbi:MAG: hypothetical protein E6501_21545, partial [Bradyrhizobium sp.]|nr:hypothetical protein [Bradyrhizobium sp.]